MVQVQVSEGVLEGEVVQNEYGGSYCSFKGIPFAEPPLGDLRFKAPQPLKPWQGVRNAKECGSPSYQFNFFLGNLLIGSEDCLYLNVYTPNIKPSKPLPVMVWIHGGGLVAGSGSDSDYGPEFLVRQGVVLVTFNYRLGILGFLCLDTEDIPGNAGMKDQVAALRWVQKNISNFGGDPNNVTIFGESAGGLSVSWHLLSPMSKGLFKRAICQSGATTCEWSYSIQPRERAIALAKQLGFKSEDTKELYEFFKTCPLEAFTDARVPLTLTEQNKAAIDISFKIVSEKQFGNQERFFYGDLVEAHRNGIHEGIDVMAGYCDDEGVLQLVGDFEKLKEQSNRFIETFLPRHIYNNCSLKDQMEVARQVKEYYLGNEPVTSENSMKLLRYHGTEMFLFGMLQLQRLIAKKKKNTTYLYKFSCKTELNFFGQLFSKHTKDAISKMPVASHADELPYLFTIKYFPIEIQKDSKLFGLIENMTKLWTNFAKFGNPTPHNSLGVKWLPYTLEKEDYLEICEKLVAGNAPDKEEFEFWNSLFKKYLPSHTDY